MHSTTRPLSNVSFASVFPLLGLDFLIFPSFCDIRRIFLEQTVSRQHRVSGTELGLKTFLGHSQP